MKPTAPDLIRLLTRHAAAFGLFSFVVTLLLLVPTVYMLQVYDRVLPSRNETTLLVLTGLVFLLYGLMVALENVRSAVCARLAARVDALLAPEVFAAAVKPAAGQPPQLLAADLATLRQAVAGPLPSLVFDLPMGLVFVIVATIVDPVLGAFVAVSIALLVGLALWQERRLRAPLKQAQLDAAQAQQALHEAARQGETVRALGLAPRLGERWLGLHQRASAQQLGASAESGRVGALQRFARLATQSLALGLGAWLVLEQRITPGMMMAASVLLGRALTPWEGLIQQGRSLAALRESWPRLRAALERPAAPAPLELPAPQGALRAEGLVLCLDGETELLAGLDFEVAPGEVVAVVGPSGAGKSMLARLLCGGMEPTRGCVRLDGAALAQWPAAQRSAAIGVLPQDVQFFDATVAENIARLAALEDDEAARAAVVRAAQAAGVHELILRLPEGYQTRLGPQGIQLSGGQRQRVGLARALYGEPAVLVLDEPNAHLDEPGEQALRRALEAHKQAGRSAVVVTHRNALLAVADRALLLRGGRIAAVQPRPALRTA